MPALLVFNAGSSSLKFQVFDAGEAGAKGRVTGIGTAPVFAAAGQADEILPPETRQESALEKILAWVAARGSAIGAVGHRIVHGGSYTQHQLLTDEVLKNLDALVPLAPLHQPHALHAVRHLRALYPDLLQVGCFDTVFHAGQSRVQQSFALPKKYYDSGVRRYGFHGLSYEWIAQQLRRDHPALYAGRVVAAHLGNGASLCAISGGKSIATTMGMTAIDGLPMGTRSGAIDAGAVLYLMRERGMTAEAIEHLLSYESGLLGLSGLSNDMRELRAAEAVNADAAFAIQYFTQKIILAAASMAAAMGGMDALVFTGGIGENDAALRAAVMAGLSFLPEFKTLTIPANEEAMIAAHASRIRKIKLENGKPERLGF